MLQIMFYFGYTHIDSAWEKEITDRVRAVDEGTAIGIDYDKAMQKN